MRAQEPARDRFQPHLDLDEARCVTPEDRARAKRAAHPDAFTDEVGIYLPPLYWASRDRTFEEILLTYWKNIDIDDQSRFDMVFPVFARLCSPENDTVVAPLGLAGWRTDELGTAGYVGPYFFRRDADAQTDTLFPIFWWVRDEGGSTLVAGPWFDVDACGWHVFGLAPIFLHLHRPSGFFEASPLHLRGSDGRTERGFALQTYWSAGPGDDWAIASAPFYFGGRDEAARRSWHVVPPLFAAWSDQDSTGLVAGPWVRIESPRGWDLGIAPLYFGGRETQRKDGLSYDVIPPLLFARWSERGEDRLWLAQTWAEWNDQRWSVMSVPLVFAGADGRAGVTGDDDILGEGIAQLARGALQGGLGQDAKRAGPVSWTNAKDGAAWSFHVIPFYSAWSFHPEHIRWRVLFGALGYERERETEQWMVLWLRTLPAERTR